jgi:hypothetical protein
MSTTNPCLHECDFTDGAEPIADTGCCTPLPTRRDCGAPTLPTFACDEVEPIVAYDPETEEFAVLTTLYDSICSAITDSAASPILTLIA